MIETHALSILPSSGRKYISGYSTGHQGVHFRMVGIIATTIKISLLNVMCLRDIMCIHFRNFLVLMWRDKKQKQKKQPPPKKSVLDPFQNL